MNAEQYRTATRLWRQGEKVKQIAAAAGVSARRLTCYIAAKPHLFPERKMPMGGRPRILIQPPAIVPAARVSRPDVMEWITETGACVTLPRVSLISCPRGM